jgi:hypothetical protein
MKKQLYANRCCINKGKYSQIVFSEGNILPLEYLNTPYSAMVNFITTIVLNIIVPK